MPQSKLTEKTLRSIVKGRHSSAIERVARHVSLPADVATLLAGRIHHHPPEIGHALLDGVNGANLTEFQKSTIAMNGEHEHRNRIIEKYDPLTLSVASQVAQNGNPDTCHRLLEKHGNYLHPAIKETAVSKIMQYGDAADRRKLWKLHRETGGKNTGLE